MAKKPETRISSLINSKAFQSIQKQFGASALTLASERKIEIIPRLRSRILPVDYALGGGWPIGRISVVYGHKSTGKSTLMTLAAASAQETCRVCYTVPGPDGECKCGNFQDMSVVYIDVEGSYEAGWGRNLGCDPDRMLIARPDYAEQALDILEALIRSKECDVIILDSIAFLTPTKEIEESVSKDQVGLQARISGKAVRKFNAAMNTVGNQEGGWKPTILFTNQIRMKVGMLFGNPETQPGGFAWGFAASNEVKVKGGKYKMDEDSGRPLYVDLEFKVDKNKCLRGSERVFLPSVGRSITVEELARRDRPMDVLSVSEAGRIQRAEMAKCWRQPEEDAVYEVSLDTGEVLGANAEHRLRTPVGWLRVGDLHVGQWVAVPKRIPVLEWERVVEPSLLRACLLGLLVGDGYVGGKTGAYLINEDPLVVSRLCEAVEEFGCEVYRKPDSPLHWGIRQKGGGHKGNKNPLYTWLREVRLWGCRAWEKELPLEVFGWSEQARGSLLGGLFATDGWVEVQKNGSLRVGFTSTSRTLSEQVQQLLLTAGIRSKLSEVKVPKKLGRVGSRKIKSKRLAWRVVVSSDEMVSRFRSFVPWMGSKTFVDYPRLRGRGGRSDRIPTALADNVEFFVRDGSVSCVEVAKVLGFENPEGESWDRVLRRRKDYISLRSLRAWASLAPVVPKEVQELLDSDLAWSRVKKIKYVGVEPVYDVSVPGVENLIVSGMVAHNTGVPKMEGMFRLLLSDTETKRKGQIADEDFIVEQLERLGILTGSGSSWKIGDRAWKGKKYIVQQLETDPVFSHEMREMLLAVLLAA